MYQYVCGGMYTVVCMQWYVCTQWYVCSSTYTVICMHQVIEQYVQYGTHPALHAQRYVLNGMQTVVFYSGMYATVCMQWYVRSSVYAVAMYSGYPLSWVVCMQQYMQHYIHKNVFSGVHATVYMQHYIHSGRCSGIYATVYVQHYIHSGIQWYICNSIYAALYTQW